MEDLKSSKTVSKVSRWTDEVAVAKIISPQHTRPEYRIHANWPRCKISFHQHLI